MSEVTLRPDVYETIFVEREDFSSFTVVNGFIETCTSPIPILIDIWYISTWQCCVDGDPSPTMYAVTQHYKKQGKTWYITEVSEDTLRASSGVWSTVSSTSCLLGPDDQSYLEFLDETIWSRDRVGLEVLNSPELTCAEIIPDTIWIRSNLEPEWTLATLWAPRRFGGLSTYGAHLTNALDADQLRWPFSFNNGQPEWEFLSIGPLETPPEFLGDSPNWLSFRDASKMIQCNVRLTQTRRGVRRTESLTGVLSGWTGRQTLDSSGRIFDYSVDTCFWENETTWVEAKAGIYSDSSVTVGNIVRVAKRGVDCSSSLVVENPRPIQELGPNTYKVYLKIVATVPLVNVRLIGRLRLLRDVITVFDSTVNVDAEVTIFDGPVYDLNIPVDTLYITGIINAILEEISSSVIDGMLSVTGPVGVAISQLIDVTVRIEP